MAVPSPREVFRFILRSAKRVAVTVAGGALVLAGLVMLVLPGPGMLVVVAGFAVLAIEYTWAAVVLERTKRTAERAARVAKDTAGKAGRAAMNGAGRAGRAAQGAAGAATRPLRRDRSDDG